MKRMIIYLALVLMFVNQACEKDPAFSFKGDDRIYFSYPRVLDRFGRETEREVDSVICSFALKPVDFVKDTVWIKVKRVGEREEADKSYRVTVVADSSSAVEGTDFEVLKPTYIFRKNLGLDSLPLVIYREPLKQVLSKKILLKLTETPDFKIGFIEYSQIHVSLTNVLPQPGEWYLVGGNLGAYHYLKYEKWIELSGSMDFGNSASYRTYYCTLIRNYFNDHVIIDPITGNRVTCNL